VKNDDRSDLAPFLRSIGKNKVNERNLLLVFATTANACTLLINRNS